MNKTWTKPASRVYLRPYRQEDISGLRNWVNDPEVTRYLGGTYALPETWEQTEQRLDAILRGDAGGVHFVIADPESGRYLGQCDIMLIDRTVGRAEVAIVLDKTYHSRGLGTEAMQLLIEFAFSTLNLRRLTLKTAANNLAAMHCYKKCGFQEEGRLREDLYADGHYQDALLMGLLRADWEAAQ